MSERQISGRKVSRVDWCGNFERVFEDRSFSPNRDALFLNIHIERNCLATGGKCTLKKGQKPEDCPNWKPGVKA